MLWHHTTPQDVRGVFDVDTPVTPVIPAALTVTFGGTNGVNLPTIVVGENGGITQD